MIKKDKSAIVQVSAGFGTHLHVALSKGVLQEDLLDI